MLSALQARTRWVAAHAREGRGERERRTRGRTRSPGPRTALRARRTLRGRSLQSPAPPSRRASTCGRSIAWRGTRAQMRCRARSPERSPAAQSHRAGRRCPASPPRVAAARWRRAAPRACGWACVSDAGSLAGTGLVLVRASAAGAAASLSTGSAGVEAHCSAAGFTRCSSRAWPVSRCQARSSTSPPTSQWNCTSRCSIATRRCGMLSAASRGSRSVRLKVVSSARGASGASAASSAHSDDTWRCRGGGMKANGVERAGRRRREDEKLQLASAPVAARAGSAASDMAGVLGGGWYWRAPAAPRAHKWLVGARTDSAMLNPGSELSERARFLLACIQRPRAL